MDKILKYSKKHLFIGMALFLCLMHSSIFNRKIIDLDEVVYLYLAENMSWYGSNYNTIKLFAPDTHPLPIYESPLFYHPPLYMFMIKIIAISKISYLHAAKLLNLLFIMIAIIYIYLLAEILFNKQVALLSSFFLLISPTCVLETGIVHIDMPQLTFLIAALFHFVYNHNKPTNKHLYFSGLLFALSMLVKYTSPLFFAFPILLASYLYWDKRDLKQTIYFLLLSSLGFAWWIAILIRFHSLTPVEFIGDASASLLKPSAYLQAISKRNWFDVWLLLGMVFPIFFAIYIPGILYLTIKHIKVRSLFNLNTRKRMNPEHFLLIINIAIISVTIAFNVINATSNGYWVFRHNMPVLPIIFLTSSFFIIKLYKYSSPSFRSWIITSATINIAIMLISMWNVIISNGLIVISPLYILSPQIKTYFFDI